MWTYYFRVPDIDAAVATITEKGGCVLQEPIEIPGGDFSMVGMDPQGAPFALVGART
jgi:predicted enzyme related to lactoylglutathione lyase